MVWGLGKNCRGGSLRGGDNPPSTPRARLRLPSWFFRLVFGGKGFSDRVDRFGLGKNFTGSLELVTAVRGARLTPITPGLCDQAAKAGLACETLR